MKTYKILCLIVVLLYFLTSNLLLAHCDTMDGPVVADAKKAFDQNNVNYVLKWIKPDYEKELLEAFNLTMTVRSQSPESKQLAERYFFETLVRLHRMGEGVPFTGIKPSGTPIDEKILAADKSVELGNLSPLTGLVPPDKLKELTELFEKVLSLKDFDVNNVKAGREYIEAYVQFFHFAEGEEEHFAPHNEISSKDQSFLPWIVAGFFLITTALFATLYLKRH